MGDKVLNTLLYVIPARRGSRGIQHKTMRRVGGSGPPLIWYSIEFLKRLVPADRIIVVTDGDDIADFARAEGVLVEREPPRDEDENSVRAVQQALRARILAGETDPVVVKIQPTQPLRSKRDLRGCVERFFAARRANPAVDGCLSAFASTVPGLCFRHDRQGALTSWLSNPAKRGEMERFLRVSGSYYVMAAKPFLEKARDPSSWYAGLNWVAYEHAAFPWVDIDEEHDFWSFEKIIEDSLWSLDSAVADE